MEERQMPHFVTEDLEDEDEDENVIDERITGPTNRELLNLTLQRVGNGPIQRQKQQKHQQQQVKQMNGIVCWG